MASNVARTAPHALTNVSLPYILEILLERNITAIGYEIIELPDGRLPILQAMSEIAGQMAIVVAARYLQNEDGGRGIILGGIPGDHPATVVILDASRSMAYSSSGNIAKFEYACYLASALSYLMMMQRDAVGLVVYDCVIIFSNVSISLKTASAPKLKFLSIGSSIWKTITSFFLCLKCLKALITSS